MQRRAHRIDLGQDIHAIPVVFDHPQQATNLTLDAPEALGDLSLRNIVHGVRTDTVAPIGGPSASSA